ncbi:MULTISPECIES: DUF3392 domain-containing protein [unclassified Halorhodospira]|uniref:DUF3392 domain-containing protein n=1 Tax=unclassified Halorhodospira TaxID=2626748 RepID=UPI001EE93CA2|nr:DUF3392 domain-containing protein [Halorhodospira sp. M39old]MCG5544786.1 DUF3392 domain-containing protein [Halorhodospira sp. M38]
MRELIDELLWRSGTWVHGHVHDIALALVATLLVVYGGSINRFVARPLRPYPWLMRVGAFVLMCAFGYGLVTVWITPLLAEALLYIETRYLGVAVIGAFLVIGWLAERRNQI